MNLDSIKIFLKPKTWKRKLQSLTLRGSRVHCVCCDKGFDTFLPAGLQLRANAACPHCGSLERHRSLWLFLNNETGFFEKKIKLLHVAPEAIFYKKFSALTNIEYFPVDKYPNKKIGADIKAMDITNIEHADNFFDVIICNHVLEHVPDDIKAMQEMNRVLSPDGWAILNVPVDKTKAQTFEDREINDPQKQLELFGQPDHVRIYGTDYYNRLSLAGFTVNVIDYNESFSHNDQFKYGLQKGEEIVLCRKTS